MRDTAGRTSIDCLNGRGMMFSTTSVGKGSNSRSNIIIIIIIIITRSLRKNLEDIPGKHSIDSLQKTAILGTSHIIRKVLQCEA